MLMCNMQLVILKDYPQILQKDLCLSANFSIIASSVRTQHWRQFSTIKQKTKQKYLKYGQIFFLNARNVFF